MKRKHEGDEGDGARAGDPDDPADDAEAGVVEAPEVYICSEKGSGVTKRLASVCTRDDMSCVSFSPHLG